MSAEVLVVDDEPGVCETLSRWLSRSGLTCQTAHSAREALEVVAAERPLLSITDIRMPDKDGLWLLDVYKERWPDMAVVMLTAVTEAQTAVECLRRGVDDYLVKPVNLEELTIAARRALEKRQLIAENRNYQARLEKMVRERTAQLDEVLRLLEATYQSTLHAVAAAPRLEPSSKDKPKVRLVAFPSKGGFQREDRPPENVSGGEPPAATAPPQALSRPEPPEDAATDWTFELSVLRSAGELICRGVPVRELAEKVADALVGKGGVTHVQFWLENEKTSNQELEVEKGACSHRAPELAQRAVASGATQVNGDEAQSCASVPIVVRGRAYGALQLAWRRQEGDALPLAERLALFIALSLAREKDEQERQRTASELDIFCEMAGATRYTLDIHHVTAFVMESLHKVVDYDVAGLLLLEEPASLRVQSRFALSEGFVSRVRSQMLNSLRLTCGVEAPEDLDTQLSRIQTFGEPTGEPPEKLRSFVNVPLTVEGRVVGQIHVSSGQESAFGQEEILFLNRVAAFLANAVRGLRDLLATVKGRIERMVDHMSDGVLMLDDRGEVVAMNEAARSIIKLDGSRDRRIPPSQLSAALGFDPLQLLREERRAIRKIVLLHEIPYQVQLSPVSESRGELAGAVVAFREFMEEKKVDEMKSEFINVVSHELRTPLTAMKNAVELLLGPRLGDLNENQKRFLSLTHRNIGQLRDLVSDLLNVSKIEAGKMRLRLEPLQLEEPVDAVVSAFIPQAEEKGVRLETDIARDLPAIHGEAALIERVLVNLVGNALKFTDRGGSIRVEARTVTQDEETLRRSYVEVAVSDSGIGIPKEQLESIFDRFHQVDRESGLKGAGTGLGLPICRTLVTAHHGRIWAESEPGKGSRFVVRLPVLSEEEVFFRSLEPDIERARRLSVPLSLVVTRLDNREALRQGLGPEGFVALLEDLGKTAQETVRRSSDRLELRKAQAEIVVVLLETPREGGEAFGRRLLEKMSAVASARGRSVRLSFGCAVFPEEATRAEQLYRLATEWEGCLCAAGSAG